MAAEKVVVEWVLTNGKLPGFEDRLKQSLPEWTTLEADTVVYRAQAGSVTRQIEGADSTTLQSGVRPILATSRSASAITRYAAGDCCMFEIHLQKGTRILDVTEMVRKGISESTFDAFRSVCDTTVVPWPNPKTGTSHILAALQARCEGRILYEPKKKGETERQVKEVVPPEEEIMVYAVGGTFRGETPIDPIAGREAKRVIFTPGPSGGRRAGRGRTFRRKAKRSNKNGHRSTRKSKHDVRRNRDA
jgi:hypothetical protein